MLECFLALVIVIYSILIKSYNHVAPLYYEEERQRLLKEKSQLFTNKRLGNSSCLYGISVEL